MTDHNVSMSNPVVSDAQTRSTGIELLRVISIILITLHHFSLYSNFQWTPMTPGLYTVQCLSLGGKVGVSLFIMITGYFMVNKSFSGKKIIRLYFQVFFYAVSLYLIMEAVFLHRIDGADLRYVLMPFSNNIYWFATSYLTLYLLVPFLNRFIHAMPKKVHFTLICLCVGLWTVWYVISLKNPNYTDFLWLILLYMIGAYIRLYPPQRFIKPLVNLFYMLVLFLLACLNLYVLNIGSKQYYLNAAYFYNLDNFYIFFISLFLFLIFINLRIPNSKLINTVASASLGVYLIQENPWVRPVLWTYLFRGADFQESPYLILYALGAVLLVFSISVIIDLIRQKVLENPLMKCINTFGPAIAAPFLGIATAIWRKIWIDNTTTTN